MESPESVQYSIYAGCHIVPGLEGLLIEEYVGLSQRAYVVVNGLVDNQVPCQYNKSLFLLQNWLGILNLRASFNFSVFSFRTCPFACPPGGGLRNHEIFLKICWQSYISLTIILKRTCEWTNWAMTTFIYFEC